MNTVNRDFYLRGGIVGIALALVLSAASMAIQIGDLTVIQGANENILRGTGIITGLAGTGDKAAASKEHLERLLKHQEILITNTNQLTSKNIAIVSVLAAFPAFGKAGTTMDVQVSSLYDCKSLEGGMLEYTLLYGIDEEAYAVAQGALSVGGFNKSGGGGSVSKNHVTVGRIPNGATIEREIPSTITDGRRMMLLLKTPDFTTANNLQMAINQEFSQGTARALSAGTISVIIPDQEQPDLVGFVARMQTLDVEAGMPTRVIINERTGTIVVGGRAMIRPCQVAHGGITITVSRTPVVSQPLPFSQGLTVADDVTDIAAEETTAYLMPVEGMSAAEVASALNQLEVTPRDMIAIFQALREAGALQADLEIM